jgi:hypothetical protein
MAILKFKFYLEQAFRIETDQDPHLSPPRRLTNYNVARVNEYRLVQNCWYKEEKRRTQFRMGVDPRILGKLIDQKGLVTN